MYPKILAAVNEHLNSEIAARYALNLARGREAKLFVCFIADTGLSQRDFDRAEEAVKRLVAAGREAGLSVEGITATGDPVTEIGKIVRREEIPLVFAATRHEDTQRRYFTGTVARSLSLKLPCSVALVRVVHAGRVRPREILVPLKAAIPACRERAFFTAKMAEAFDAKVFLFHATRPITRFFHGEIHLTPLEWEKHLPGDIADFMEHLNRYGIPYEKKLAPGAISRSITLEAAARRHDLLIMGASERSLLRSILRGNPVEEVLRETPCDLIILRPRHEG
ncbi:MAG: universal stress protein [Nitrospirae bacterium]|nr:universal stress protein [Nitrospirota bacterium]